MSASVGNGAPTIGGTMSEARWSSDGGPERSCFAKSDDVGVERHARADQI